MYITSLLVIVFLAKESLTFPTTEDKNLDPTDLYKSQYSIEDEEVKLKKLNKLYWCRLKCGSSWLCLDQCSQSRFIPTTTFQPITTPSTEELLPEEDSIQLLSGKMKQFWKCRFCSIDDTCWKICLKQL